MRRLPTIVFTALALALAVGLATAVSPFASSHPDGLERVAIDQGFIGAGAGHPAQDASPIAGSAFPGVRDPRVATGAAGFVGTLGIFALGSGIAWTLRRGRRARAGV
ncbi:MAG TPA: PDGLE domain-containing protein [Miltoncostaeaceae bacterium]|nr:PDGLE domain-containing protein [Miltoncostaeaceae bacterium]